MIVIVLHYFQGGFAWEQVVPTIIGSLAALLQILEFLKGPPKSEAPPLQPIEPKIKLTLWDQEAKRTIAIGWSGSEALKYVDGMSRLLIHQPVPATGKVVEAAELMQKEKYHEADAKAIGAIEVIESSDVGQKALELSQFYLIRGDAAFNQGEFTEAKRFYNISQGMAADLKNDFLLTATSHGIGAIKGTKGDHDAALEAFEQILKNHPELNNVWYNKGVALGRLGKTEEALKAFNEAVKLDPKDADAWCNKGVTLVRLGKYEKALEAFDEAIKLDPRYASAWINKGSALGNLGRYEDAIQTLNEAIKLDPTNEKVRQMKREIESRVKSSGRHSSNAAA